MMPEPSEVTELSEQDKDRVLRVLLHQYENTWIDSRENGKGLYNLLAVAGALTSAAIAGGFAVWDKTPIGSALVFNVALPFIFLVVLLLAGMPVYSLLTLSEHRMRLEKAITTLVGNTVWQSASLPFDKDKSENVPVWGLEQFWHSAEHDERYARARKLKDLGVSCGIGVAYLFSIIAGEVRVITAWDDFGRVAWVLAFAPFGIAALTAIYLKSYFDELNQHSLLH